MVEENWSLQNNFLSQSIVHSHSVFPYCVIIVVFNRDIGWKVQAVSPISTFQTKLATSLICMHTENLYFMMKYFQLCESGTEKEDCNICEQNQSFTGYTVGELTQVICSYIESLQRLGL